MTLPQGKAGKVFEVNVSPYDDTKKITLLYSEKIPNSLPSFFRILNVGAITPGNQKIIIEDFRDYIRVQTKPQMVSSVVDTAKGFGIPIDEAIIIWYLTVKFDLSDYVFKLFSNYISSFSSERSFKEKVKTFEGKIETQRKFNSAKIKVDAALINIIKDLPDAEADPWTIDGETIDIPVVSKEHLDLSEIFNRMDTSRQLPFIFCRGVTGKSFFRVSDLPSVTIPEEWWLPEEVTGPQIPPGIYFKVLIAERNLEKNSSKKSYAECRWKPDEIIRIEYKTRSIANAKKKILAAINESVEAHDLLTEKETFFRIEGFSLSSERQIEVSGTFGFYLENYNPFVLAHLISLDPVLAKFAFLNEVEKTEPRKQMFRVYLSLNQKQNTATSLQLSIYPSKLDNYYSVRIRHCKDSLTARVGVKLFQKVLGVYVNEYQAVVDYYSSYPAAAPYFLQKKKRKAERIEKKTGKRLIALHNFNPKMFKARYGDQCQHDVQPYVVATVPSDGSVPEEVVKLRESLPNGHDKVMEFAGVYYACEPRPEDEKESGAIWPGLKVNTDTATKSIDYRLDYPCLPCCFKKARGVGIEAHTLSECLDDSKKGSSKIYVSLNKLPEVRKYAVIPHNLSRLAKIMGIEKIEFGKGVYYPYLRLGVEESGDSFLHCIEHAVNSDKYNAQEDVIAYIQKVKMNLLNFWYAGSQELYNVPLYSAKREFTDHPEDYLPVEQYISLIEYVYKIRLVVLTMDSKTEKGGEFLTPTNSGAFLPDLFPKDRPVVVLFKQAVRNGVWPFQCSFLRKEPDGISSFSGDEFVDKVLELYDASRKVYSISTSGINEYH